MRVEAGELERVIILMPPRHGKSLTSTIFFPAWFLGRNPDKYVISASYGQDLAEDFGQKVRNHLQDPLHRMVFPQSVLSGDSQAKDKFTLTEGGMYFAVGRGSAITGRGAHCLVAGTLVETERGPMPIEELAPLVGQIRVVAHQFSTGKDVLCRVRAFRAREARGVRIVTRVQQRLGESTQVEPVAKTPYNGLYEVRVGNEIIYSDAEAKYVFIGRILDAETSRDMTQALNPPPPAEVKAVADGLRPFAIASVWGGRPGASR